MGPSDKPAKNLAAVAMGRMGGLKGGKARAQSLTPERRAEIARKAAEKRWGSKMRVTSRELEEARRKILEEHQKDIEALERMAKFL